MKIIILEKKTGIYKTKFLLIFDVFFLRDNSCISFLLCIVLFLHLAVLCSFCRILNISKVFQNFGFNIQIKNACHHFILEDNECMTECNIIQIYNREILVYIYVLSESSRYCSYWVFFLEFIEQVEVQLLVC